MPDADGADVVAVTGDEAVSRDADGSDVGAYACGAADSRDAGEVASGETGTPEAAVARGASDAAGVVLSANPVTGRGTWAAVAGTAGRAEAATAGRMAAPPAAASGRGADHAPPGAMGSGSRATGAVAGAATLKGVVEPAGLGDPDAGVALAGTMAETAARASTADRVGAAAAGAETRGATGRVGAAT